VNRQCGYVKFLGVVILLFFAYFTSIRGHGTEKIWGRYPGPLGAPRPFKFFLRSKLGLARCIHRHFATVGLRCFWPLTLALSACS